MNRKWSDIQLNKAIRYVPYVLSQAAGTQGSSTGKGGIRPEGAERTPPAPQSLCIVAQFVIQIGFFIPVLVAVMFEAAVHYVPCKVAADKFNRLMQVEQAEPVAQVFRVRGRDIPVYGKKLGQALLFLPAKNRHRLYNSYKSCAG